MKYVQAHIQEPEEENYIDLCVAVIKFAIEEEGLGYLDTDGGRYWCELAGINPASLRFKYENSVREGLTPTTKQPERIREKAPLGDNVYKSLDELMHVWCNVEVDKPD